MLELTIPHPDEGSGTTKDLVFSILSREHPLSLIQLSNRIRKKHNVSVTYQAVRKATERLHEQGVLVKEERKYRINKEWVLSLKRYFDNLLATFEGNRDVHGFVDEMRKEDYAVYTFHNLLDLDDFWGDVIRNWSATSDSRESFFSSYNYDFWFLINLGRETRLYEQMIGEGRDVHMLVLRDAPLNEWGKGIYEGIGANIRTYADHDMPDTIDCNVMGDMILQVKYPEKITKRLRSFYAKYRNTQEMSHKEITEIVHTPGEIKLILFKNPSLARDICEKYLGEFRDNSV